MITIIPTSSSLHYKVCCTTSLKYQPVSYKNFFYYFIQSKKIKMKHFLWNLLRKIQTVQSNKLLYPFLLYSIPKATPSLSFPPPYPSAERYPFFLVTYHLTPSSLLFPFPCLPPTTFSFFWTLLFLLSVSYHVPPFSEPHTFLLNCHLTLPAFFWNLALSPSLHFSVPTPFPIFILLILS